MVIQLRMYQRRKEMALECIDDGMEYSLYIDWVLQSVRPEYLNKMTLPLSKYLELGGTY